MAPTILVDDIERGTKVLKALDDAGFRARAAFWQYAPESSDWRLVIALPAVDLNGPRSVYETLRRILSKKKIDIPLWRITALSTDHPLVHWAQGQIKTAPPGSITFRSSSS